MTPHPVLRPPALGQSDPSFGAKQECLGISAFGITRLNGVAKEGAEAIQCLGGFNRRRTGTKFAEFRPTKILVLDIVTKEHGPTLHLPFGVISGQLASPFVAKLDDTSTVDRLACLPSLFSDR